MDENILCLNKHSYTLKLSQLLNEIIKSDVDSKESQIEIKLSECKKKQHGKNNCFHYVISPRLTLLWTSLYDCEQSANDAILLCLDKLRGKTKNLCICLKEFKIENSVILFKVNEELLFQNIIHAFLKTNMVSVGVSGLPYEEKENTCTYILCYLSDNISDVRTLSIASLFKSKKYVKYLYMSKKSVLPDLDEINATLNLDIEWINTPSSEKEIQEVYDVLKKSTYFAANYPHQEERCKNYLHFIKDAHSSNDFLKHEKILQVIYSTKLYLTDDILASIKNMDKVMFMSKNDANYVFHHCINLLHCGVQSKSLFARQFSFTYMLYCDLKYGNNLNNVMHNFNLFHGLVKESISVKSLFCSYKESVMESFNSKYGNTINWISQVHDLTSSNLKLLILEISLPSCINLSTNWNSTGASTRFSLYNYSRISSLLRKYHEEIKKGVYPPLPPLEDINFALLKEDDEKVILDLLWQLPNLLLQYDKGITLLNDSSFRPHSLVVFVSQLSRSISSYYSRHHVLVGGLCHLFPIMHARIYFLNAVQCAMKHLFYRLGITPLNQM